MEFDDSLIDDIYDDTVRSGDAHRGSLPPPPAPASSGDARVPLAHASAAAVGLAHAGDRDAVRGGSTDSASSDEEPSLERPPLPTLIIRPVPKSPSYPPPSHATPEPPISKAVPRNVRRPPVPPPHPPPDRNISSGRSDSSRGSGSRGRPAPY
jgi:hypothetical protein